MNVFFGGKLLEMTSAMKFFLNDIVFDIEMRSAYTSFPVTCYVDTVICPKNMVENHKL